MKIFFMLTLLVTFSFAEYEKGKIDMHGGKDDYSYGNGGFSSGSNGMMGMLQGNRKFNSDQNRSKSNFSKK